MKRHSRVALLLALVMLVSLFSACAGSEKKTETAPTEAPAANTTPEAGVVNVESNGKTRPTTGSKATNGLVTAYSGTVSTIDPELFTQQDEDTVLSQIFEPLFLYGNDGELIPLLAESWVVNEDGSVDFTLREGVKFHSGDTLKAEDVEYTLSRCEYSPIASGVYGNVETEIHDDLHFTWTFPHADEGASWDDLVGFLQTVDIVNKSWAEGIIADPNEDLVYNEDGTGPYTWGGIEPNQDITLNRFADYWGESSIETIKFVHISGSFEVAFESGDLDLASYVSPDNFQTVCGYENVYGYKQPVLRVQYVTMRSGEGDLFEDYDLRLAATLAMEREDLAYVVSDGTGQIAYTMATPLNQYYVDNCDHFERDVERSKEIMTGLGYSESNPLKVTLVLLSSSPTTISCGEILKEELEESYFEVNIEETPDRTRLSAGDFDMTITGIGLLPSYGSYLMIYTNGYGLNYSNSEDETVKAAFAAAKDKETMQEAMKISTESLHYVPLCYPVIMLANDAELNVGEFNTSLTCYLFKEFSWK